MQAYDFDANSKELKQKVVPVIASIDHFEFKLSTAVWWG